jgi:hypothetical protein
MSQSPFKKPSYLSQRDAENCYPTSRGWVVLYPNGKYDIIQTYKNLDTKIKEWEAANGVTESESEVKEVRPELKVAKAKFLKSAQLQEQLDAVREELAEVTAKIEIEQIVQEAARADEVAVAPVKKGRKSAAAAEVTEVVADSEVPAAE